MSDLKLELKQLIIKAANLDDVEPDEIEDDQPLFVGRRLRQVGQAMAIQTQVTTRALLHEVRAAATGTGESIRLDAHRRPAAATERT